MSEPCIRYFTAYTGVALPFKLVGELGSSETENRNTFFAGVFDGEGRLLSFQKRVYGEVEMEHRYDYDDDGGLARAEIVDADGEVTVIDRN